MKVKKKSGKPFKSGNKINTVKETIDHPINKDELAYTFIEDDSYVSIMMCDVIPEKLWHEDTLYDADENCEHDIQPASGGGVKCTKCSGWFCF